MTARFYEAGTIVLEPKDAAFLWQLGRFENIRVDHRDKDEAGYSVLKLLYQSNLIWVDSVERNQARKATEKRQTENQWVTPDQIARQKQVTARTVRNDIARGLLPARKVGRHWTIKESDAITYLEAHKPN